MGRTFMIRDRRADAVRKNRKRAREWLAEQDGPLRTIIGELLLLGCILEFSIRDGVMIKFRGPGPYDVAYLGRKLRFKNREDPPAPLHEVYRREIGWTSGLHRDPVRAVEKYIDKFWRGDE